MYHILNDQMNIHSCRDIYVPYSEWSNDHSFTLVEIFMYHILNDQMNIHSCRDIYVPYSEWSNEWSNEHSLL